MLHWPDSVLVLDPECGHQLGLYRKDQPIKTGPQWGRKEFTEGDQHSQMVAFGIWQNRFYELASLQAKYRNTFTIYDAYNAAWVSCGYHENQSEKAFELCDKRYSSHYEEVE